MIKLARRDARQDSRDGQRFVMVEPESRPPIIRFHVVTNWFES